MMDNVTAVNYVNKAGGTKSASLNDISQRIISWCEYRSISLHAFYPPGDLNREADLQSRVRLDASDWMVNPSVFSRISCHRMHSRPVCLSLESATRDICELATPALSPGHRRVQPGLASSASLRLPCICPDPAPPGKNQERSTRSDVGSAV